jgi:hypothetical protein
MNQEPRLDQSATAAPSKALPGARCGVGGAVEPRLAAKNLKALDRILCLPLDPAPSPGGDRFTYTIMMKNNDGSNLAVIKVPEDQMPDALASIPQIKL